MSRYLADTHVWLWMVSDQRRLTAAMRDLLAAPASTVLLSAASAWEIAIKHRAGKLRLPVPPGQYVPELIARSGTRSVVIEMDHVLRVAELPDHHRDPFDRLLIAQAQALRIPLISADPVFERYELDVLRP